MMLKFKGKPWELKAFLLLLIDKYGEKITIKELIEKSKRGIIQC